MADEDKKDDLEDIKSKWRIERQISRRGRSSERKTGSRGSYNHSKGAQILTQKTIANCINLMMQYGVRGRKLITPSYSICVIINILPANCIIQRLLTSKAPKPFTY